MQFVPSYIYGPTQLAYCISVLGKSKKPREVTISTPFHVIPKSVDSTVPNPLDIKKAPSSTKHIPESSKSREKVELVGHMNPYLYSE